MRLWCGSFSACRYGGDIEHSTRCYKFTGKERDAETCTTACLDYFGARHNASSLGRFMSPDQRKVSSSDLTVPQKWNKYAYTINNPLAYFDPDGKEELEIQLRAYIPQSTALFVYKGDDRGPSISQIVTSRTDVTFRIQTDQSKLPPGSSPLLAPGIGRRDALQTIPVKG